jgi:endoglucanase
MVAKPGPGHYTYSYPMVGTTYKNRQLYHSLSIFVCAVAFIIGIVNFSYHKSGLKTVSAKVGNNTSTMSTDSNTSVASKLTALSSHVATPVVTPKPPQSLPTDKQHATSITPAVVARTRQASPLSASLYVNPSSQVALQARIWANAHASDAAAMNRLASQPIAQWFGDWNSSIQNDVNSYVASASAAAQLPVLVAYNIPERDCGSYSAGGASNSAAYNSWIQAFAAGIGNRQAIVVLEPDALASMSCLNSSEQANRLQIIANAVHTLKMSTAARVYIDAGNPTWQSAVSIGQRLSAANIASADGFSINISNFTTTNQNISYGNQVSAQINGKHFVIDTSRNGNGPSNDGEWCNPSGRAVGHPPTLQTGVSLVDAYLWIKAPGESDGACGPAVQGTPAPSAGAWWPQYALMLLS